MIFDLPWFSRHIEETTESIENCKNDCRIFCRAHMTKAFHVYRTAFYRTANRNDRDTTCVPQIRGTAYSIRKREGVLKFPARWRRSFDLSETFFSDRKIDSFFFVPASIKRTRIGSVRPSLPLFDLPVLRFLFLLESPRFSAILKLISGYLFRFPIISHSVFFFSFRLNVDRAVIIYRSNVHNAFELQGKRLLAQEMSSMQPSFDTGTPVCFFDCTKKFNSGTPRSRRFELCIMLSSARLCNISDDKCLLQLIPTNRSVLLTTTN